MSEVFTGRGAGRQRVVLGRLLGEGAAGKVHALPDLPGMAAKLYHPDGELKQRESKIDAMLANPPQLPPLLHRGLPHSQIAWPQAKLFDAAGRFIGFLMPEIDGDRSTSLVNLLQKSSRRAEKLSHYYGYRVLVARNLAAVAAALHQAGHHMIDMKPANLRFYPATSWMAVVDTDGFSIAGRGAQIPAEQVSDEYIAPESWQKAPVDLGQGQDEFALAVIIFQLLNNGVHPFAGAGGGAPGQATDLQGRILAGLYPYGIGDRSRIAPSAASLHRSFQWETRMLFDRAFTPGAQRPSAIEWRNHLEVLIDRLEPCATNPSEHAHFGTGCGFCAHDARVAAAVRSRPPRAVPPRVPVPGAATRPPSRAVVLHPRHSIKHPPAGRGRALARGSGKRPLSPQLKALLGAALIAGAAMASINLGNLFSGEGDVFTMPELAWAQPASAMSGDMVASPDSAPFQDVSLSSDTGGAIVGNEEPRDYVVVPTRGAMWAPLYLQPDRRSPEVDRVRLSEVVIGRPATGAEDGQWVEVAREGGGRSGYLPRAAVLERKPEVDVEEPKAPDCLHPDGRIERQLCADPGLADANQRVDRDFRVALASAEGYIRLHMIEQQRTWRWMLGACEQRISVGSCLRESLSGRLMELGASRRAAATSDPFAPPRFMPSSFTSGMSR